jgi:hypothetical protein
LVVQIAAKYRYPRECREVTRIKSRNFPDVGWGSFEARGKIYYLFNRLNFLERNSLSSSLLDTILEPLGRDFLPNGAEASRQTEVPPLADQTGNQQLAKYT